MDPVSDSNAWLPLSLLTRERIYFGLNVHETNGEHVWLCSAHAREFKLTHYLATAALDRCRAGLI